MDIPLDLFLFFLFLFIFLDIKETIETHAPAFLLHNNSSVARVNSSGMGLICEIQISPENE